MTTCALKDRIAAFSRSAEKGENFRGWFGWVRWLHCVELQRVGLMEMLSGKLVRYAMNGGTTDIVSYRENEDPDAYGRIYERFKDAVNRKATLRLPKRILKLVPAQAVCDTAIRKALKAIKTKPVDLAHSQYLERLVYRILKTECFALFRRYYGKERDERRNVPLCESNADFATEEISHDVETLFETMISISSDRDRKILEMRWEQGMSTKDIAHSIGLKVRSVQVILKEARDNAWRAINDDLRPGKPLEQLPDEF